MFVRCQVQILGSNENKTGKVLPATKVGERLGMAIPESWNAKSRCPTFTVGVNQDLTKFTY